MVGVASIRATARDLTLRQRVFTVEGITTRSRPWLIRPETGNNMIWASAGNSVLTVRTLSRVDPNKCHWVLAHCIALKLSWLQTTSLTMLRQLVELQGA